MHHIHIPFLNLVDKYVVDDIKKMLDMLDMCLL